MHGGVPLSGYGLFALAASQIAYILPAIGAKPFLFPDFIVFPWGI